MAPADRVFLSAAATPSLMGIWRLGDLLYTSQHSRLFAAQPADAQGCPRFDYVLRTVSDSRDHREDSIAQLTRFATAAATARHPNLMAVLDTSLQSANPFLIMPRLVGATLAQWTSATPPQPLPVVLWVMRQAAQGLAALHATSWMHGDVKPDNLFISQQGHVTLIDFGFARQLGSAPDPRFLGTPRYAAPELLQAESHSTVAASDVFALGRILFELLTWSAPTVRNQSLIEPVAELISEMISGEHSARPVAQQVASRLLRLEIETLGEHIQPQVAADRRAA